MQAQPTTAPEQKTPSNAPTGASGGQPVPRAAQDQNANQGGNRRQGGGGGVPVLERGHDHLRGDPAHHERAGDGHRAVQGAPDHREGEHPPLLADADPQNT